MPSWLLKSAVHRAISWLPMSQFWNKLLQTHVTRSLELTSGVFESKLEECTRYLGNLKDGGREGQEFVALELGTGWYPTIPVGLYLCGAKEIHTIDIDPLLQRAGILRVLDLVADCAASGKLATLLPGCIPARVVQLAALREIAGRETPAEVLGRIGIKVLVADAQALPMAAGTVDLIFSSGVLEYIPAQVLANMMAEFRRVARPGARMIHRINLADQYASFDRKITVFNHLQYSAAQWKVLNSPLIWQNRLRLSDYKRLIAEAGFRLETEENKTGHEADLNRVKMAPEFGRYERDDLLVIHSYLVSRVTADSGGR